jgi:1-deoxy-D-xylulose-5-phosphate reductoisomerase
VIEARWLFGMAPEQIRVVIHPEQIVHSMVQLQDSSILAQLGTPDMRVPIACGLSWPERMESGAARLDFTQLAALTFEPADAQRFPGLHLSWQALRAPEGTTTLLNAANEVGIAKFFNQEINILELAQRTIKAYRYFENAIPKTLDEVFEIDKEVRQYCLH